MKTTLKSFVLILKTIFIKSIFLLIILFSTKSYAACIREDVSYYLKQGFNQEQIVKLCARQNSIPQEQRHTPIQEPQQPTLPPQENHAQHPNEAPPSRHSEATSTYGNLDAIFLSTAVEAYEVEVTEDTIMFTRKDCFDYGEEDWNEFQERACPRVKYAIDRNGLKIVDRDNGFFGMGSTALYISGDIKAEILDLDQFKTKNQEAIRTAIQKNTEKLKINIRSGMSQ
ncbi:MAG: hypothetical protein V3U87_17285, partial [Methylococcaceae bacterium]